MVQTEISQLGTDARQWVEKLRQDRSELNEFRQKLQEPIGHRINRESMPQVEHYENQFDIQLSNNGKMHAVDSNDISFKIAGSMDFRQAFREADPQLLEPVWHVEVLCPDELTGHVMGDLQTRRAIVEGMETEGRFQRIAAKVPLVGMDGYSSALRSITQGRARFRMGFHEYAAVPFDMQRKLMEEYRHATKDEEA